MSTIDKESVEQYSFITLRTKRMLIDNRIMMYACRARVICQGSKKIFLAATFFFYGEFDSGSERTLAAYLTHASRTRKEASASEYSGERVRNT